MVFLYLVQQIPFHYYLGKMVWIFYTLILILLLVLVFKTSGTVNANRWLRILGINFQPSAFAVLSLVPLTIRFLYHKKNKNLKFWGGVLRFWLPVAVMLALILPADLSSTVFIFTVIVITCILGGYSLKYLLYIFGIIIASLMLLFLFMKAFPETKFSRFKTWENRLASFGSSSEKEGYQVQNAKIAIATGGLVGVGIGKSVQKNFLPQATSDFIFAILLEEYGLVGGGVLIICYIVLLRNFYVIACKTRKKLGKLLVASFGFAILLQALVNMFVAIDILPVTGQPLPIISSGGSSVLSIFVMIGIVLSVCLDTEKEQKKLELEKLKKEQDENID